MLTEPNLVEEHKFRTPLMAAVVRKDLPIFMALLRRFEKNFSSQASVDEGGYCAPEELHIAFSDGLLAAQLGFQLGLRLCTLSIRTRMYSHSMGSLCPS